MALNQHRQPAARSVWVWLPRDLEGRPTAQWAELLYEGSALARRSGQPLLALCGAEPSPEEQALLRAWGVAAVHPLGSEPHPHPLALGGRSPLRTLTAGQGASDPAPPLAVLLPGDAFGAVTGPLLAAELDALYVPDATSITWNGTRLVAARSTLAGQYEALVTLSAGQTAVCTLLPGAVGSAPLPYRGREQAAHPQPYPPLPVRTAERVEAIEPPRILQPDPQRLDIADAERIVAFGRGAFSEAAVALVERLALLLGAAVAGTRPAADEGWLPFVRQVGLTGAIVHPRLYVAVGISGAPYHMVGVKEPETLIAINQDPAAPILAHADLGLVGDLHQVLPRLIEQLEQGATVAGLRAGGEAAAGGASGREATP